MSVEAFSLSSLPKIVEVNETKHGGLILSVRSCEVDLRHSALWWQTRVHDRGNVFIYLFLTTLLYLVWFIARPKLRCLMCLCEIINTDEV